MINSTYEIFIHMMLNLEVSTHGSGIHLESPLFFLFYSNDLNLSHFDRTRWSYLKASSDMQLSAQLATCTNENYLSEVCVCVLCA